MRASGVTVDPHGHLITMCGIVGWAGPPPGLPAELIRQAASELKHRGPDDEGLFVANRGAVVLGHRRLSIIDLSAAANQPMELPEAGLAISFNGEIYNYLELRAELEAQGCRFRTTSDTETLLHAWAQWGPKCLPKLTGMFAFALYDARRRQVVLARDCFGIKPLFYTHVDGRIVFASEIPPLLGLAGVSRKANARRVLEFLHHGTSDYGDQTFFEAIRQIPPAHFYNIPLDGETPGLPVRYWSLERDRTLPLSFDEAAKRLRDLFVESVSLHLRSDVPLGIALSGGIDSSSVLMSARALLPHTAEIQTFSYIADDPGLTEERWVDDANRASRAVAHKFGIRRGDMAHDFDWFVGLQGEPVLSPVAYAQMRMFQEASKSGIKVLLEGQGADEMLAGYPLYLPARLASLARNAQVTQALRFARNNRIPWRRAAAACLPAVVLKTWRHLRGAPTLFPWIQRSWAKAHGVGSGGSIQNGRFRLRESLNETLSRSKLPAFLRWGDRNSMVFSIENRVPFLTPRLAEFVFALPEEYLIANEGTSKSVFRAAMRGLTPDSILDRKIKIGFDPPYRAWIEDMRPQSRELLEIASEIPALDADVLWRDCAPFLAGEAASMPVTQRLWGVFFLAGWTRQFGVVHR
jgi:asparagine synthase (glutamine-hydrolysing)